MYLTGKTIGSAELKSVKREIPGNDGYLDLTECFGRKTYGNRKLKFEFVTVMKNGDFSKLYSKILADLHNEKMKIILDDDCRFYYYGRVNVSNWVSDGKIGRITIECDCDPYKYRIYETVRVFDVSISKTDVLVNLLRPCVPVFNVTGAMSVVYGGKTYSMASAGVYTFPELMLEKGNNVVCFNGTGTVTVKYREGTF